MAQQTERSFTDYMAFGDNGEGFGFYEPQALVTRAAVICLRTVEIIPACFRLLGHGAASASAYGDGQGQLFEWTDAARAGLDRHVSLKRARQASRRCE